MNTPVLGPLIHNPKNAVTESISREQVEGDRYIRKVLSGVNLPSTPPEWRASNEPMHWNYWRREAEVYSSRLGEWLGGSGVRFAKLRGKHAEASRIILELEDISGRTGHALSRADYVSVAGAWGDAQGRLMQDRLQNCRDLNWFSRGFLRHYTGSKPVDYGVLSDDQSWAAPQVPCHLDFWPNNVFVDDSGEVVLIDLGFWGWGSFAEDIGNFVPDAVFDGFLPAEDMIDVADVMFEAYQNCLLSTYPAVAELPLARYLHASAVKYVWLGPLLLQRAGQPRQTEYGGALIEEADANFQYRHRGLALLTLCEWAEHALTA